MIDDQGNVKAKVREIFVNAGPGIGCRGFFNPSFLAQRLSQAMIEGDLDASKQEVIASVGIVLSDQFPHLLADDRIAILTSTRIFLDQELGKLVRAG